MLIDNAWSFLVVDQAVPIADPHPDPWGVAFQSCRVSSHMC